MGADSRDECGSGAVIRPPEDTASPPRANASVSEAARPLFAGMNPGMAVDMGGSATEELRVEGDWRGRERVGEREEGGRCAVNGA